MHCVVILMIYNENFKTYAILKLEKTSRRILYVYVQWNIKVLKLSSQCMHDTTLVYIYIYKTCLCIYSQLNIYGLELS